MKHKELTFVSKDNEPKRFITDGICAPMMTSTFSLCNSPVLVEYKHLKAYAISEYDVNRVRFELMNTYAIEEREHYNKMIHSQYEFNGYNSHIRSNITPFDNMHYYSTGVRLMPHHIEEEKKEVERVIDKMMWGLNGQWITLTKGWLFKKLISVWALDMSKKIKPMEFYQRFDFNPLVIKPKKELKFI